MSAVEAQVAVATLTTLASSADARRLIDLYSALPGQVRHALVGLAEGAVEAGAAEEREVAERIRMLVDFLRQELRR